LGTWALHRLHIQVFLMRLVWLQLTWLLLLPQLLRLLLKLMLL
jgi:hypothetical protein